MTTRHTLACDLCDNTRKTSRYVLELDTDAAWSLDLCPSCKKYVTEEVDDLAQKKHTAARVARAKRAQIAGKAPYSAAAGVSLTAVRQWANENGVPVSGRGRISGTVIELYKQCRAKGSRYLRTKEAQATIKSLKKGR